MSDPTALGVAAFARALRARELSAAEATAACLDRIRTLDPRVQAFATVTVETALDAARAADVALARGAAGPLAGIPVAVKENTAVRGVAQTNGCPAFAGAPAATVDAAVVARLRAAGAIIVGVTRMNELAFAPTGVNPIFGTPANPWGDGRMPGGSSSGSGVAVASGLVAAALGTDTGGSVRIPASLCGVTGLKPTYGRVSRNGITPLAWTLDHVGPITRSAEDAAVVLETLAGHDPADVSSAPRPADLYAAATARSMRGVRVGVLREFAIPRSDREVARAFEEAIADLGRAGATVRDVVAPSLRHAMHAMSAVLLSEADAALRPLLGPRLEQVSIEARMLLELAKLVGAAHYLAAGRLRARLYAELRALLAEVHVLALPTTPVPAPAAGEQMVDVGGEPVSVMAALSMLTAPFNLVGLPALALPCGFTAAGLPVSLQLVGRPFGEASLLAAGAAYQRETDWHARRARM